jgi:hypothetical protein
MSNIRRRSEEIRNFVLDNVEKYPADIATKTGLQFSITRQAVNKHLLRMVEEECLSVEGKTKSRVYKLKPETAVQFLVELEKGIEEDVVWRERLLPLFGKLPDNISRYLAFFVYRNVQQRYRSFRWDYCASAA